MINILSPSITPRLKYSFELIFKSILKTDVLVTDDIDVWLSSKEIKISYGLHKPNTSILHFTATTLLFESTIEKQNIIVNQDQDIPTLFPVQEGALPFDPFAAAFFLVTRYEEYISNSKDKHDRYYAEESLAYKNNFLHIPVVNYYAGMIKEIIQNIYPSYDFPLITYKFTPTIDIDTAYAYKYKKTYHQVGALIKNTLNLDFKEIYQRIKVHLGQEIDPYDSYEKQLIIHERFNVKPIYFFLIGDRGPFDRNLQYTNIKQKQLIQKIQIDNTIGLHPSYASNTFPEKIKIEKRRLEEITGQEVTKSRQHYLKLELPVTYQRLIQENISEDYSMGYASKLGFRASICNPFYFYDLSKEEQTTLLIHPFFAMDTTLKKYLKTKSTDVIKKIKPLFDHVKHTGGEAIIIFHNESIGGKYKHWKRWGDIYEKVIQVGFNNK
jgi:hypothetical protein